MPDQEKEIQRLLADKTPDQSKMIYALWTRKAVKELINLGEVVGISLAV